MLPTSGTITERQKGVEHEVNSLFFTLTRGEKNLKKTFSFSSAPLLRYSFSNPLQVGRVALVDGEADDLGHFIRMIRTERQG